MKFETTNAHSAADHHTHRATAAAGPYETRRRARTDVADIHAQCAQSTRRGVIGEVNLAHLQNACEQAGVTVGQFDARILAWPAAWEPETCAVIAGLMTPGSQRWVGRGRHCWTRTAGRRFMPSARVGSASAQNVSTAWSNRDRSTDQGSRAHELVSSHGETGATARLVPFTVDGLILPLRFISAQASRHRQNN